MRSLIIDMISFNPGISYKEVSDILEINYENVRKIWHTYKTSNRREKIYNKKSPHIRNDSSEQQQESSSNQLDSVSQEVEEIKQPACNEASNSDRHNSSDIL